MGNRQTEYLSRFVRIISLKVTWNEKLGTKGWA